MICEKSVLNYFFQGMTCQLEQVERNFWVTFIRKNPMRTLGEKQPRNQQRYAKGVVRILKHPLVIKHGNGKSEIPEMSGGLNRKIIDK